MILFSPLPVLTDEKLLDVLRFFIDEGWRIEVGFSGKIITLYTITYHRSVLFLTVRPNELEIRADYNLEPLICGRIVRELEFERHLSLKKIYLYARQSKAD